MRGALMTLTTTTLCCRLVSTRNFVSSNSSIPLSKRSSVVHQSLQRCHWRGGSISRAMAGSFNPALARQPPAEPLFPAGHAGKYKVAVCQLSVVPDKEANIAHAKGAIENAADKGAQLIVLPEMWNCPYSNDSFPIYAEEGGPGSASPSSGMLSEIARKKGVTIVGGSIPERSNGRLYNTCYIFGKNGEIKGKHRKVHLFDIDIPGKITFKESETLTAGEKLTVVDTDVGRIGIGICYDIRFPEMAMLYAARGVHLIAYPGAFNMTTGPLHWELLQKARYSCELTRIVIAFKPLYPVLVIFVTEVHHVRGFTRIVFVYDLASRVYAVMVYLLPGILVHSLKVRGTLERFCQLSIQLAAPSVSSVKFGSVDRLWHPLDEIAVILLTI